MDRIASEWSRIPSDKQRSVVMAVALTVIGAGMLISGMVLFATEGMTGMLGLFFCGLLALIPGIYYSRIAWLLLRNRADGYVSWEDVPSVS